ncbi:MAG: hypothetical protein ACP5OG_00830 [Candidatus Nanoarchaeia archaeon]
MKIAQIRRKLNDSQIGQKINGSYLGILAEGANREVGDALNSLGTYAVATIATGAALLVGRKRPLNGLALAGLSAVLYATAGMENDLPVDAENHYAHTSRLYQKRADSEGKQVMDRAPVKEALLTKLAEKHPQLALGLALNSNPQNGFY